MGEQAGSGTSPLDRPRRQRRLADGLAAGAGQARAHDPVDHEPARHGRKAVASSRSKRTTGGSPVVPWTRWSAISRIHQARCASSAAQLAKLRPAMSVALDVPDSALVLALGSRPVGCAGARPHAPVAREGVQPFVEDHLAGLRVVVRDQRAGVVEQDLGRQPAEVAEGAFDPVEPSRLALVPERSDEGPARVAEGCDEQEDPRDLAPDHHTRAAEVDLHLPAWRCLEPHRRTSLGGQLTPEMRDRPLDRAEADGDPVLGQELLPHHIGIAPMAPEALGKPVSQPVEGAWPAGHGQGRPCRQARHSASPYSGCSRTRPRSASSPNPAHAAGAWPRLRPACAHPLSAGHQPAALSAWAMVTSGDLTQ